MNSTLERKVPDNSPYKGKVDEYTYKVVHYFAQRKDTMEVIERLHHSPEISQFDKIVAAIKSIQKTQAIVEEIITLGREINAYKDDDVKTRDCHVRTKIDYNLEICRTIQFEFNRLVKDFILKIIVDEQAVEAIIMLGSRPHDDLCCIIAETKNGAKKFHYIPILDLKFAA